MKKDNKKDELAQEEIRVTERISSNIRSYFTKEVNEKIAEMSIQEMQHLMKTMVSSPEWIAILKYTSLRMMLLDTTLRGTDPVKDPSKISWSQGAMAGLCDVENYVIDLNSKSEEEESTKEKTAEGN